jgi:hypothetical protein
MPLALDDPPPAAPLSRSPWIALLHRIAEETELGWSVRIAGELLPVPAGSNRTLIALLADALHARWFLPVRSHLDGPPKRRDGGDTCLRLADALHAEFLGRQGWTFAYRTPGGIPVFSVAAGDLSGRATASCYLDLAPAIAPEVFGRLVSALDGHGVGFRAELRSDPAGPDGVGPVVVSVTRGDATALTRVAIRMRERSPFVFGPAVPAFTRVVAPGIALADDPDDGTDFGRHRCRAVATGLVAAAPGALPAGRRAAVLRALADARLDPAALHLNPGNTEFRV